MKLHDEKYLAHFYDMVMEAVACGLTTPQEWLKNYSRAIAKPYDLYTEIQEFCDLATEDLFNMDNCKKHESEEVLQEWLDKDWKEFQKNHGKTDSNIQEIL